MYYFDSLPQTVQSYFAAAQGFANHEFLTEFPGTLRKTPLTKTIVSFGLGQVEITQPTDEDGATVYDSFHECSAELKFTIHAPRSFGGSALYLTLAKIADGLLNRINGINVEEFTSSGLKYDSYSDSVKLEGKAVVRQNIS